jgi:predicted dehydrogenase
LRAAVVGCGWIGSGVADDPRADGIQSHAAAYTACENTQLVAVCDTDLGRAEHAAQRWGLRRGMGDVAELLAAARPQIVSICTPDATHAAVLREVMGGADILAVVVEKPLALDLTEARSLVELARHRGVTLAVNYLRRFSPSHIEAQRRIAAGAIGNILAVEGKYTKGIYHNGTHWFDLARWMIGDIAHVQAWPGPSAPSADPTCHVRVVFADGQTGFMLGLNEEHFTIFEMDIVGTEGRLRIADGGMRHAWFSVAPSPYYSNYRTLQTPGDASAGFKDVALRMVEDVVSALRLGTQPQCSGEDGLATLAVADAACRSLAMGIECAVE